MTNAADQAEKTLLNGIDALTIKLGSDDKKAIRVINHYSRKAAAHFGLEAGSNPTLTDAIHAALKQYSAQLYQQHGKRW